MAAGLARRLMLRFMTRRHMRASEAREPARPWDEDSLTALEDPASEVFRMRTRDSDRFVAVRLWFAADGAEIDSARERVQRAMRVSHPMLAAVEGCEERGNGVLRIMSEYVPGPTLETWSRSGRMLPLPCAVDFVRRLSLGVDVALAEGVGPHAINPRNLVVRRLDPQSGISLDAKLLDLDVAASMRPDAPQLEAAHFMAPEALLATLAPEDTRQELDARAQVFACGALLYFLTTGSLPFRRADLAQLTEAHAARDLIAPRRLNGAIPEDVELALHKALSVHPAERYSDPAEFASALPLDLASAAALEADATKQSDEANMATASRHKRRSRFPLWISMASVSVGVASYFTVLGLTSADNSAVSIREETPGSAPSALEQRPAHSVAALPQPPEPSTPAGKPHPALFPRAPRSVAQAALRAEATLHAQATPRREPEKAPALDLLSKPRIDASSSVDVASQRTWIPLDIMEPEASVVPSAPSTPAPKPKAVAVAVQGEIAGLAVRGSLIKSSVGRAIERVLPQWNACYQRSPQATEPSASNALHVDMTIDEMGRVRNPRVTGHDVHGLDECIARASTKLVSQAPDTGTVDVSFDVRFRHSR
jgi:hypothetical protein